MDLYETIRAVLNELHTKGQITMSGKQFVKQTFFNYAQQTINLNNNQCGSTMTGTQKDITTELLRSVNRYVGFPKAKPLRRPHHGQSRLRQLQAQPTKKQEAKKPRQTTTHRPNQ